ncbi:MAG: acetyltransferase [Hydrogenophilales bacterium 16-64-46]|nr:MAG: acetyltransferase [Hydrogenophilales bacterium 12-64-13]OYZ06554.1 MAG: acetyltransferase [Hydrogenophilales bacterium 16-64-46]OZA39262.1 MAG: acetyltransferase [Hydrogenophilales bacterium 17-64-34]HQS98816.1 acetyltransferase [Thiobacillus sp.]
MHTQTIDVFNGDADGICALHQLRLDEPCASLLVTGPKREIDLLKRVSAGAGDRVTVLDISLAKNRTALDRLLEAGARVRYFDHHQPGEIPDHPHFEPHIDTDANVCSSLLVNAYLQGRQLPWAVVAAFGDNLAESARLAAVPLNLDAGQLEQLQTLGECLNYNGYGETLEDLFFDPAELYRQLSPYADPFAFIAESPAFQTLKAGYAEDMARALALQPAEVSVAGRLFILPAEKWARRISGVYGNRLAVEMPELAHAVLTAKPEGGYLVSVRAPLVSKSGADTLCSQFETGGGRKGAAGVNHLPESELGRFIALFNTVFTRS